MSDWEYDVDTPEIIAWMKEAQTLQQNMFLRLGDREWDEWDKSEEVILFHKVAFGLYPFPDQHNPDSYSKGQLEIIKLVVDAILKNAKSSSIINFACIFIFGIIEKNHFFIPLFKVKGKKNQTLFIASDCSVYESWHEFLNSNRLPKCRYCYPRNGLYQGEDNQVLIDFGTSPACNPKSGTFSINTKLTEVTFGSSFTLNSLFPAPIATTPEMIETSSASIGMDDVTQSDKDLENPQLDKSLISWMREIAFNFCQSRLHSTITQAAAAGDLQTKTPAMVLPVNAVVAWKDFFSLVENANRDSQHDVHYFTEYFIFYSNSIINKKTAREIIEITQQLVLNRYCDDLTDQQTGEFIKLSEHVKGRSDLHRNARKIKAINHIGDKNAFFESLVTVSSEVKDNTVRFSFEEPGLVSIDDELHIAPSKFVQISENDRQVILDFARKKKDLTMNNTEYWKKIETILKENRVRMQFQRRKTIDRLKQVFNTDKLETIKIGNEQIFKNITPFELDRLDNVMTSTCKNYDPKILKIANEFAKMRRCKTPLDYCNYVEFVAKYVNDLNIQKEQNYTQALNEASVKTNFNRYRFDQEYGIRGKRKVHFSNEIFDSFDTNCKENFKALEQKYITTENAVLPLNERISPNFSSDTAATYHYYKHSDFGSEQLTAEQYFEIASELVNNPCNRRSEQLNQQGNKTIITFTNPINRAKGIVFETLPDGKQSLATVYYD